jgi:hypothetical protein
VMDVRRLGRRRVAMAVGPLRWRARRAGCILI